jgi:hypothetical protein
MVCSFFAYCLPIVYLEIYAVNVNAGVWNANLSVSLGVVILLLGFMQYNQASKPLHRTEFPLVIARKGELCTMEWHRHLCKKTYIQSHFHSWQNKEIEKLRYRLMLDRVPRQ